MSSIKSHRDLEAWQRAFRFGLRLYEVTRGFPTSERFGLTSQIQRGAISVASNISEGYGRGTTRDYLRFLRVARGALFEIDTQLLFAHELGYIDANLRHSMQSDLNECGRLLAGLIRSVERTEHRH